MFINTYSKYTIWTIFTLLWRARCCLHHQFALLICQFVYLKYSICIYVHLFQARLLASAKCQFRQFPCDSHFQNRPPRLKSADNWRGGESLIEVTNCFTNWNRIRPQCQSGYFNHFKDSKCVSGDNVAFKRKTPECDRMTEIYATDRKTEVGVDAKIVADETRPTKKRGGEGLLDFNRTILSSALPEAAGSNRFLKSHLRQAS